MSNEGMLGFPQGAVKDDRPLTVRIEEAYMNGASDMEICKILRMTYSEFQEKYDSNLAFRKVVDIGRMMQQAWWLEQGRHNIHNSKFNTSLWMFNMKNRFGWADKTETVNQDLGPQSLDELKQKLVKMLPAMAKQLVPEMTSAQLLKASSGPSDEIN